MKKYVIAIIIVTGAALNAYKAKSLPFLPSPANQTENISNVLQAAFNNQERNLQIRGAGRVYKILPDDMDGSRHQRFLIRTAAGQSVLVAHNIDLAEKIHSLETGDIIEFYGEYEWSPKGGVIHWTHHDPNGSHVNGWLKHRGIIYQ